MWHVDREKEETQEYARVQEIAPEQIFEIKFVMLVDAQVMNLLIAQINLFIFANIERPVIFWQVD